MHETRPDDTAPRWAYFDVSEDECSVIVHGDRRYFLLRISKHRTAFVADACPHRGGPLHMGSWDSSCSKVRCPWHRHAWGLEALGSRVLPAIRRGRQWSVVLPDSRARPYKLKRRVVSQDIVSTWGIP
jgi:nitrite reductase (NADH) small subunit